EAGAVLLVAGDEPVLLAGGVEVVRAAGQARLDYRGAQLGERPDGVEDHLRAGEQGRQGPDVVAHLGDLVVGRLDAGHGRLHPGLQRAAVAAGGDERDVVLAQVLADQPAGVAGGTIDDDRLVSHRDHIPIPPSTGRPAPLMKLASSEARKTTADAMSATSP